MISSIRGVMDNSSTKSNEGKDRISNLNFSSSAYTIMKKEATVLSTPAEKIEIVPRAYVNNSHPNKSSQNAIVSPSFAEMLRDSAQYIHAHRNKVMVVHVSSKLMEMSSNAKGLNDENLWDNVIDDVSHMWLLGVKLVIVLDCRSHINKKTFAMWGRESLPVTASSVPVDSQVLRVIKEELGFIRFEAERCLVKALSRFQKEGGAVSGNFYSANPVGIVDGQDFMFAGNVRNVDVDKISRIHDANEIVIVSPLGISPSGELFYVNSHETAARFAISLRASKLIYCLETPAHLLFHTSRGPELLQSLQYADAKNLYHRYAKLCNNETSEMLVALGASMAPLQLGVKRAHFINPSSGALLQELYTVSFYFFINHLI